MRLVTTMSAERQENSLVSFRALLWEDEEEPAKGTEIRGKNRRVRHPGGQEKKELLEGRSDQQYQCCRYVNQMSAVK